MASLSSFVALRRAAEHTNQRVFEASYSGCFIIASRTALNSALGFPHGIQIASGETVADLQEQLHVLNGAFQIPRGLRDVSDFVVVVSSVLVDELIAITGGLAYVVNAVADEEHWDTNLRKFHLVCTVESAELGPRVGPDNPPLCRGRPHEQVIHR
jgi:hypothetical protein